MGILCYLPLILGLEHKFRYYEGRIVESVNSDAIKLMTMMNIGASVPLLFDLVLDYHLKWDHLLPRLTIILGMISNALFFLTPERSIPLYFCTAMCRGALLVGGLFSNLVEVQSSASVKGATFGALGCGYAYINMTVWEAFFESSAMYLLLQNIFHALFILNLFYLCVMYFKKIESSLSRSLLAVENRPMIFVICLIVYMVTIVILAVSFGMNSFDKVSTGQLVAHLATNSVVSIIALVVPARMQREDAFIVRVSEKHYFCIVEM